MFKKVIKILLPNAIYGIMRRFYFWLKLPPGYEQQQIQTLQKFLDEMRLEIHSQKIRAAIVDTKLNSILYGLPQREDRIVELVQRALLYDYPGLLEAEQVIQSLRGNPLLLEQRYATRIRNLLMNNMLNTSGESALHIGCENGNILEYFARQLPHLKAAVGIGLIGKEDQTKPGNQIFETQFIQTSPFDYLLNLSEESFDFITIIRYLELLTPIEQTHLIELAFRRLRPGGTLYIEIPNLRDPEVMADTYWIEPRHLRPISASLLMQTAARVGKFDAGVFDSEDAYVSWNNYQLPDRDQRKSYPDFVLTLRK